MPLHFLRKLLAIQSLTQGGKARLTGASTQEREVFERQLTNLTSCAPADLQQTFQDAIQSCRERPATGPELLDAMHQMHVGLGVAIGRGETGEDKRYEQLGRVVEWLYDELGRPENTQYAVVMSAATELRASEQKRGEAEPHSQPDR